MASIRVQRVREKVKHDVARIIQTELKDPRKGFITVTNCDLSGDFRHAKIYVSVLADREGEVNRVMGMLEDATGFIQSRVAKGLRTRVTPELRFVLDKGAERSVKISSLLDELREEREQREASHEDGDKDGDETDETSKADDEG